VPPDPIDSQLAADLTRRLGIGRHPYRLTGEIHALSEPHPTTGDQTVITVQRWEGAPDRATLIVARDGQITQRRARRLGFVDTEFGRARSTLATRIITEETARAVLAKKGQPNDHCSHCGDLLPIGLWRCKGCGLSIGRQTGGRFSGAARRGDVTFRLGDPQ